MIGGYVGPAEGAAITAIAANILQIPVHQCLLPSGVILDMRYNGNLGREALWASSITYQASSRNTKVPLAGITSQVSGPCTYEVLYEEAAGSINDAVSGCAWQAGNRPAAGRYANCVTPLEQKFAAEVLKSCACMKRSDANEIVKVLVPKYENTLRHPPKGKDFTQCMNLKTLKPTQEWRKIYETIWEELEDLGVAYREKN